MIGVILYAARILPVSSMRQHGLVGSSTLFVAAQQSSSAAILYPSILRALLAVLDQHHQF